jgi:hypothetical protein
MGYAVLYFFCGFLQDAPWNMSWNQFLPTVYSKNENK